MVPQQQWQQIKKLTCQALALPPEKRLAFLSQSTGENEAIFHEVMNLVQTAESEVANFLEAPLIPQFDKQMNSSGLAPLRSWKEQVDLPPPPLVLKKYALSHPLGTGGAGSVYAGRHLTDNRPVAIKVQRIIPSVPSATVEQFRQEALITEFLHHPNTVRVFDYGVENGFFFLILEQLTGETLRSRLKYRGRFLFQDAIQLIETLCDTLFFIHVKGVLHCDLKPENIFFHSEAANDVIKILDFGISQFHSPLPGPASHFNEMVFGTPRYMSPEQFEGRKLDVRSDLYALALIAYEVLSGYQPHEGQTSFDIILNRLQYEPRRIRQVAPEIPSSVEAVLQTALARNPADRFPSIDSFHQAMKAAFAETRGEWQSQAQDLATFHWKTNEIETDLNRTLELNFAPPHLSSAISSVGLGQQLQRV